MTKQNLIFLTHAGEAILTSTHNICSKQEYEKFQSFLLSEKFQFLEVKFSICLNRRVFLRRKTLISLRIHVVRSESQLSA